MKIYLIGDLHGELKSQSLSRFLVSRESNICIQLGDFGYIWAEDFAENFLDAIEKNYPNKEIFTILGNHENYDKILKLPIVEKYGAKVFQIRKNIFAVLRGEILTLDNMNFLCVGGADSQDKDFRELYEQDNHIKVWWEQERVLGSQVDKAIKNCSNKTVHYVLTHEAPSNIVNLLFTHFTEKEKIFSSAYELKRLYNSISFEKGWFCGHYHIDKQIVLDWSQWKFFQVLGIDQCEIVDTES